ncbi:gluconokinase [Nostocoides australiense]
MEPDVVIVMGASGTGKTTVATGISTRMGWTFAEGDAFHPQANVDKMRAGVPLTDEDRAPWLRRIGDWISEQVAEGESCVVTCSALKRDYRDVLREGRPQVRFLHLHDDMELIAARMAARKDHFMMPTLLPSQFATLQMLGPDEPGVVVTVRDDVPTVIRDSMTALGLTPPDPAGEGVLA